MEPRAGSFGAFGRLGDRGGHKEPPGEGQIVEAGEEIPQQNVSGREGDGLGQGPVQVSFELGHPGAGFGHALLSDGPLQALGHVGEAGLATSEERIQVLQGPGVAAHVGVGPALVLGRQRVSGRQPGRAWQER